MKTALVIFLAIAACFAVYASSDSRNGVWTAALDTDGSTLQVTLFQKSGDGHSAMGRGNNVMGFELSLASLTGLTAAEVQSTAANVQFTISRPAGTITFDGRFASGNGAGSFRFTPSEPFVREMASLGYAAFKDHELLCFATSNFTPQTVRDLRALGYQPSQREIVEAAIFRIDANAVREFSRLGYANLSFRDLVNFRIGRVDAAYINGMRELGYTEVSAHKLADLAILGVTPAYVRELRAAGLKDLSPRDAEQLRIGNITPAKISDFQRLGYHLTAHELGEFGVQGVTPKSIEELNALGYGHLTAHQLVEMRIFGVTPEYIRKVEANGYKGVPVDKLIQIRMSGADELMTGKK